MAKTHVPRRAFDSNAAATVQALMKQLLPAFEQFMGEEAAEPAHQGVAPAQAAAPAADPSAAVADPAAANAASAATAAPAAGGETGTGEVAAEGASAGGEGAPATAATGGAAEGEGETDAGGDIKQAAQAVIQAIQAFCALMPEGGQAEAQPAAAAPAQAAAPAKKEGEGGDMGGEATGGESTTGEPNGESTEDALEGLEATVREGADEGGDPANAGGEGGQGTASPGPSAGKHTGADAALRNFYADAARKTSLVDRLSKVVGAFDGALDLARATASDVAAYGVTKLKLKCAKGQEVVALDAYLSGLEAARGGAATINPVPTQAADSAEDSVVSAYLKQVS